MSPSNETVLRPKIVVNADGAAAAIWLGGRYGEERDKHVIRAAIRSTAGVWGPSFAVSDGDGQANEADVAIDAEGNVTFLWNQDLAFNRYVTRAATRSASGQWSETVDFTEASASTSSLQLAIDQDGDVTAVWLLWNAIPWDHGIVQSSELSAVDGEWSLEPTNISGTGGLALNPTLSVNSQGEAIIVWHQRDTINASGYKQWLEIARRHDGEWGSPEPLSVDTDLAGEATAILDSQGRAHVIWLGITFSSPSAYKVQARSTDVNGDWEDVVVLTTRPGAVIPSEAEMRLVADSDGTVSAIWSAAQSTSSQPIMVLRSARRESGEAWGSVEAASPAGMHSMWSQLAIDPRGYVTVVWSGFSGGTQAVRSRVLDHVAPDLLDVSVPTQAVATVPVSMSAAGTDALSAVTLTWTFGDGHSASGATVSHAFEARGQHEVTVTATDAAGNQTHAARTLTVDPAPITDPPPDPNVGGDPKPDPDTKPTPDPDKSDPKTPPPPRPAKRALLVRNGKLVLRGVKVKRTRASSTCPRVARVRVSARSGQATIKIVRIVPVKPAKGVCRITAKIPLKGQVAAAKRVRVVIKGRGLKTAKRRVKAQPA